MSFRAPSVNYVYQTPLSSSQLTNINKNRMIYANYITKVQNNNVGCVTARTGLEDGVAAGSIITDLIEGARFTTEAERDRILATSACQFPAAAAPPAPNPGIGGSMIFTKGFESTGTQVTYPNNAALAIGQQDFTIEWFQFATSYSDFPRPFSIGSFGGSTISIAVSYEIGVILIWNGITPISTGVAPPSLNTWSHVALVGTGGTTLSIYINGTRVYNDSKNYNFTNTTTALSIGNESNPSGAGSFNGRITNFRWVKGTAVYTGTSFTVPTAPLTAISGTQLLLLASNSAGLLVDSSPANRTPTNLGVEFSTTNPF